MKYIKWLFSSVLSIIFLFSAMACSMAKSGADGAYAPSGYGGVTGSMTMDMEDAAGETIDSEKNEASSVEEIVKKPAGLITAAAWNDNTYFEDWKKLFEANTPNEQGKFVQFTQQNWGFTSQNRIKVTSKNGETPIPGTKVTLLNEENKAVFSAVSDANGVAYVFTDKVEGEILVSCGEAVETLSFTAENRDLTVEFNELCYPSPKLDVIELMFVVDVTGSMGDELEFLKNEIADVMQRVATANASVEIRLAMLYYRDHGDEEVFSYHDFVTVTGELGKKGLQAQQAVLDSQYANGGGDYPEAVDEALELAVNQQWSTGVTTKMIFHVLDAPPHAEQTNKTKYYDAVLTAAEKGIRFCPVLCSGAAALTEYLAREAAVYTGSTFVFVTDDSGIGNAHHDPNLPNAVVEGLNSLMVRLINGYHTGTFAPPVPWREEVK